MALTKVPGTLIADDAITSAKIADDAITSAKIDDGTIVSGDIADTTITSGNMALDPRNASNLSSGQVALARLDNVPTAALNDDIAILAFKTQANGNLARYNLVDQSLDAFEDASGVNSGTSTAARRDATGKYYSGGTPQVVASGGAESTSGNYTFHYFTANGNYITDNQQDLDVLLIGGG